MGFNSGFKGLIHDITTTNFVTKNVYAARKDQQTSSTLAVSVQGNEP